MSRDIPNSTGALIADLVDNLQPVQPLRFLTGLGIAVAGLCATLGAVVLYPGIRPDVMEGRFDAVFLLATGLFLLLGMASAVTVIVMGRPHVGTAHDGWVWAAAMTALLPMVATIIGLGQGGVAVSGLAIEHGFDCLMMGNALAIITFATLIWWLRRGAPTSPQRAGLLTGMAAGSFGIFAFSFHCGYSDIVHIGIWHSAAVLVSAIIGRLAVPPLIRW